MLIYWKSKVLQESQGRLTAERSVPGKFCWTQIFSSQVRSLCWSVRGICRCRLFNVNHQRRPGAVRVCKVYCLFPVRLQESDYSCKWHHLSKRFPSSSVAYVVSESVMVKECLNLGWRESDLSVVFQLFILKCWSIVCMGDDWSCLRLCLYELFRIFRDQWESYTICIWRDLRNLIWNVGFRDSPNIITANLPQLVKEFAW